MHYLFYEKIDSAIMHYLFYFSSVVDGVNYL